MLTVANNPDITAKHRHSALDFVPPRLDCARTIRDLVESSGLVGNDLNFANMFLLRNKHSITISLRDGMLYRHYAGTRLAGYAFPLGTGNIHTAIENVLRDAKSRNRPPLFCLLTAEQTATLETLYPGRYRFVADRGSADYLYSRTRLANLAGRDFHRKRNFMTRFEKTYPQWRFVPLTTENLPEALTVARRWFQHCNEKGDPELVAERLAIDAATENFAPLALSGGIVYIKDVPCAMCIGSQTNRFVYDVHFEKVVPEVPLAHVVVVRETARLLPWVRLINREEDLNLPGLRDSKLSWFPESILLKYSATPIE